MALPVLVPAAVVLGPPVVWAFRRALRRARAAAALRLEGPEVVDEHAFVELNGLAQWVGLRGESRRNPLLLIVHGGPGAPYSMLSQQLRGWERRYTVVQWDQRGAGKTWGRSHTLPTGFAQLAEDGLALARQLGARFEVPLVLLGSSAGSITALRMAAAQPGLFSALVLTDLNVGPEARGVGTTRAVAALRAQHRERDAAKLEALGQLAHPTFPQFERLNRLLLSAARGTPDMVKDLFLPGLFTSPLHGLGDVLDFVRGQRASTRALLDELLRHRAEVLAPRLALPVVVLQADTDYVTEPTAARAWLEQLAAPSRAFHLLPGAGHLGAFAFPDATLRLLDSIDLGRRDGADPPP